MGILQKLLGREKEEEQVVEETPAECTHSSLVPRWDDPADIGKEDKASGWTCSSCNQAFTPAEREELRAADAERVRHRQQEIEELKRQKEELEAQEREQK